MINQKIDGLTVAEHMEVLKQYRNKVDSQESMYNKIQKEYNKIKSENTELSKLIKKLDKKVTKLRQLFAEVLKIMLFKPMEEEIDGTDTTTRDG